jgi:hypothetical protein
MDLIVCSVQGVKASMRIRDKKKLYAKSIVDHDAAYHSTVSRTIEKPRVSLVTIKYIIIFVCLWF